MPGKNPSAPQQEATYYLLGDGQPMRKPRPLATLEVLNMDGTWVPFNDPKREWGEAVKVSPLEFQAAVKAWAPETPAPAA